MPKIIIDNREPKELIRELAKDTDIEIKQLITADFIIQTKNKEGKEITVGIERKTIMDFLNSIIDKRLLQQLIYLKDNFNIPLLVIEGEENIYMIRNFHPNAIRGMLSSIAIDFQIPILQTKNYRDTASLIRVIAKRLEKPSSIISLLKKRKPLTLKEQQEYLISSLPLVGPTLSKSLLTHFKSIKNIINASSEELQKVEKLGPKKAKLIKDIIEKEY